MESSVAEAVKLSDVESGMLQQQSAWVYREGYDKEEVGTQETSRLGLVRQSCKAIAIS